MYNLLEIQIVHRVVLTFINFEARKFVLFRTDYR